MSTRQKLLNEPYIPEKWETVACPVCGSDKYKKWERFGNTLQYTYVLCKNCTLVYLNPRPAYDEAFVYDAYEFYADNDERYNITSDYYQKHTSFEKREALEACRYDKYRSHLLDVGCATGKFLYRSKTHYKKVTGVEVSARMAALVSSKLGVEVLTTRFEELQTNDLYSCIHMSHVLEHFPSPNLWLQKAATLLAPDGILVISVPNMFSADRLIKNVTKRLGLFVNKWEAWRTPDHLFEPTYKAMQYLFDSQKFKIIDCYSYSRTKAHDDTVFTRLYHHKWRLGSNLKFIVKPI